MNLERSYGGEIADDDVRWFEPGVRWSTSSLNVMCLYSFGNNSFYMNVIEARDCLPLSSHNKRSPPRNSVVAQQRKRIDSIEDSDVRYSFGVELAGRVAF